jgi:hypothetical protein
MSADQLNQMDAHDKTSLINQLLLDYVQKLSATLPRPNSTTTESQKTSLESFEELLDKALDSYLNTELIFIEKEEIY